MADRKFDLDSLVTTPEYVDCLCVGTSIIMSLEACYQSRLGKKVLMVDSDSTFGGAWKTIEIAGIKDVENAIHYFLPNSKGLGFLRNVLKWPIEISTGKYRYFNLFLNNYVKFSYQSPIDHFIYKKFFLEPSAGLLQRLFYFLSCFKFLIGKKASNSYYVSGGSAFMIKQVKSLLLKHSVEFRLNTSITNLYFDTENNTVSCIIGNRTIIAKSLTLGHGARLPTLKSNNGNYQPKEIYNPRPAFHLVVSDDKKCKAVEAIVTADPLIKYVHDVSRFSSLSEYNPDGTKVFVFALQSDVKNNYNLCHILFKRLKDLGLIRSKAEIISYLYSDIILPTLSDQELYSLKAKFGDLVNILRTENFTAGVGHYAEKWNEIK